MHKWHIGRDAALGPYRGWYPVANVVLHPILLPVPCRTSRDETWQDVLRDGKSEAIRLPIPEGVRSGPMWINSGATRGDSARRSSPGLE